ncbi:hypothetical protein SG34_014300 [Thalassomonas viridans]|uniref:Adenosine deaminase domain-containing protein n=1 Tax=Thalassomonas viridans TaxID=137584 RepID=A0AAE9ZAJ6_9GAMM|nr:antiviral RADAR system adenosine deaminase RdrB [Thalassomonas viridans]WDE07952.1 hypothetical protein SG34_014300 [Thalassomonas viridans]
MLINTLENTAATSLLNSDRWLFHLLTDEAPFANLRQVAHDGLTDKLQAVQRRDDIEKVMAELSGSWHKNYSLDFISRWQARFLTWQGNHFEVAKPYLDEWLELCSIIDPSLVLGWGYAQKLWHDSLSPQQLAQLEQCMQGLGGQRQLAFADNHAHIGGHGSQRQAFVDFSFEAFDTAKQHFNWPSLPEYRFISAGQLNAADLPRMQHALFCFLAEALIWGEDDNRSAINLHDQMQMRYTNASLSALLKQSAGQNVSLALLARAVCSDTDKSALLIWTALFYAERYLKVSGNWRTLFRAYIHVSQILRTGMIHKGLGLSYFTEFFRFSSRKGHNDTKYGRYALTTDINGKVYREFKVAPSFINQRRLSRLHHKLAKAKLEHNIQFCIHFARSGRAEDKLQRKKRLALKQQCQQLVSLFSSYGAQHFAVGDKLFAPESGKTVNLLNLVRGLDVAGNENQVKIEVFAPSLRYLRASPWKNPYPLYRPQRRLHLSIHCGEDFDHLLSGLRHIDETVAFCGFGEGDRLGHALALGITPDVWAKRHSTVRIKAGEHLDNLVWLYHQAVELSLKLPEILPLANRLEIRAAKWCRYLYGESYDLTTLYSAWQLRRNCPLSFMESMHSPLNPEYLPDFVDGRERDQTAIKIWRYYFTSSHLVKKGESNRFEQTLTLRHVEQEHPDAVTRVMQGQDYFTPDELDWIGAIQDQLMHRYDDLGLTIEVCPSSNVYIGHFDCFSQHPLFRWAPPLDTLLEKEQAFNRFGLRKGPVRLCVNTDDAGLFPTTIANEHRILKEVAIRHFAASTRVADAWIEGIRKTGLEEFQRNRERLSADEN